MSEIISNGRFDEERAMYGKHDLTVTDCAFDGPADGESAFKECSGINVKNCYFNLRYPFWHDHGLSVTGSELTSLCRAALWYSDNINIANTKLHGIKALRECAVCEIYDSDIISPEFGWSSRDIKMERCRAEGEYFMLRAENLDVKDFIFRGKYSFQYIKNSRFENCEFDTKDAFWHAENVTVINSVIKGEYLSWYSDGLTLINCKIIGTQPLCYCRNLRLVDCEMTETDLCFEKSHVQATLTAPVISIKNPASGTIYVPAVNDIIKDDENSHGDIIITA